MKNNAIIRKPLLNVTLNNKIVTSVDVREIAFAPSHKTDLHKHPCPVIGFVVEGTAVLEVQGQFAQQLPSGSELLRTSGHRPRGVRQCFITSSHEVRRSLFAERETGADQNAPRELVLHSGKFHARKPTRKTSFAHVLEHLSHLRVLAQQIIYFLN